MRFGRFTWFPSQRKLLEGAHPVPIGARAYDLLCVLIDNRDRVMTKDELLELAWPGVVVEENNLSVQISALRKVLGDDAISTVPGRGYRWAAPVEDATTRKSMVRTKPSIAVLPFANPSGNPEQEYFSEGLAEDIVGSLSRSPWIFVVASASSFQFRGGEESIAEACGKLGVQYVLLGTVRCSGDRLRVSVELIHGPSGEVIWAERYDRQAEEYFDIQEDIARKIVGTIEPAFLKHEEARATREPNRDRRHWDLVMRARWHYWRSSKRHTSEAKRLLEQALQLRPDDVATLSLLAFSLSTEVWSGWASDAKATATAARQLAVRAVAIDDMDAFAHFTLGVALLGSRDVDGAIAAQRRALALYPHFAAAAAELGRLLSFYGETIEGERLTRQAMTDSPTDPRMGLWIFGLGIGKFVDARYGEAAEHARAAISLRRDWFFNHFLLSASLVLDGKVDEARVSMAEGVRLAPLLSVPALCVGHPFKRDLDRDRYISALRMAGWTK